MGYREDKSQTACMLEHELRGVAAEGVAVLCVGNAMRGDDGFGPAVAQGLEGRLRAHVFDGGAVPENDLPLIARLGPQVVIIVDAVDFRGKPGELRLLDADGLAANDFSTHAASLSVAKTFLSAACGARVLLLAAQPARVHLGEELSEEMLEAAGETVRLLAQTLGAAESAPNGQ
jgi:hydrogenase 3 maturation protease